MVGPTGFRRKVAGSPGELCKASPEFLGRWHWDWFVTVTFCDAVNPWVADKRFRLWIKQANREVYGRRWHKNGEGTQWIRAAEYQRRGVLHFHALFARFADMRRLSCSFSNPNRGGLTTTYFRRRLSGKYHH